MDNSLNQFALESFHMAWVIFGRPFGKTKAAWRRKFHRESAPLLFNNPTPGAMANNDQQVGDVLRTLVRDLRLGPKLTQTEIRQLWKRELGQFINAHTLDLRFDAGTLIVKVDSSVLRHELLLNRAALIDRFNRELTQGCIRDIEVR